jgi:phosphotriesterase-related protein
MIGHMCGNTDIAYHLRTLDYGVNIAFDRFGIQGIVGTPMDTSREGTLLVLLGLGYENRIMLSHDSISVWLGRPLVLPEEVMRLLANWHPLYLFEKVIPRLRQAGVQDTAIHTMTVTNPYRLFGGEAVRNIENVDEMRTKS